MKNAKKILTVVFIALLSGACTNYFHDLIPPDDNRILSFELDGQIGMAVISDNTVSAFVEKGTDINSVVPRISVSNKATLLPVTFDYVMEAFPSADLYKTAMNMNRAEDITSFVMDMIKENPDFNIPALDKPIDFTGPVTLLVVSGQGNIRQYTAEITVDTGEPRLLNFGFSKYDNAELVIDASCVINETDRTVTANALYPVDMDYLSFKLVPSFQIQGESLSIDGIQVVSGITEIQFMPSFGSRNKTIRVTRNGEIKDYTLTITFSEDPDTVRSITDFRFNKIDNPGIAANAVASIINTDNTGTIIVQVFYSGAKTPVLTPRFISPGRVSAGGITQTNGVSKNDFSSHAEYRVVSKNGLYTRIYTVKVEFISLTDGAPRITAFRFSSALNLELVQDASGEISDGIIMIEIRYGGSYPPISLIPEFSAEGLVTVYGSAQVSGASPQEFIRQIKYTVTNPVNPLFTRDYWVQCRMIRDTSSEALITSFGFYPEDNTGLADEVIGKIDQINKKITLYAPVGSGIASRTMFPRFTAAGQVNVAGTGQVSGVSGRIFDATVTYTVVSANGVNSKSYAVTVRELQTTIYVDCNAFGHGDGLNWENAFRSLKQACEAAVQFPEDTPKEIWIAKGTYKPGSTADDYFPLSANTSYIGGFAGHETTKNQRNVAANLVIISGDTGAGAYSKRLFSSVRALNGDLSFDSLQFTGASGAANGGGINAALGSFDVLNITNCAFNNLKASDTGGAVYFRGGGIDISNSSFNFCNGGAVFVQGTTANIKDTKFSMCTGADAVRLECSGETDITRVTVEDSSALNLSGNGGKTLETVNVKRGGGIGIRNSEGNLLITNSDLSDISGNGVSMDNLSGNAEIISLNLRNISGFGIYGSNSSPGRVRLSGIAANAVSGSRAVSLSLTHGAIILVNSNFTNNGVFLKTGSSSLVDVSNINITSVTNGSALTVDGGNNAFLDNVNINGVSNSDAINISAVNAVIDRVIIDNVPNGRGINIINNGNADISNTVINNCVTAGNGGGISISGSGNANISAVTITRCKAYKYGGGMYLGNSGNVSVSNITIDTVELTGTPVKAENTGSPLLANYLYYENYGGGIYRRGGSLSVVNSVIRNVAGGGYECTGIFHDASTDLVIDTLELNNISGYGIYNSGDGVKRFSNITAANTGNGIGYFRDDTAYKIGETYCVYSVSMTSGSFTLSDSILNSCGVRCSASAAAIPMKVINTEIYNATYGIEYLGCGTLTIDRVTIEGSGSMGVFCNGDNSNLQISNSSIKGKNTGYFYGIFTWGSSSVVYDNTIVENGRQGLSIRAETFIMNSGRISGNSEGGVIMLSRPGHFIMNGGTISGNTNSLGGGVWGSCDFTMNGGTISGNKAISSDPDSSSGGGGVRINNGNFIKTGGIIYGNDGSANANVAMRTNGTLLTNHGHAIHVSRNSNSPSKRKETTAGPDVNLSFIISADGETAAYSGAWD